MKPDTATGEQGIWSHPPALSLPKPGLEMLAAALREAPAANSNRLSTIEFARRGRHAFMTFFEDTLQHELRP